MKAKLGAMGTILGLIFIFFAICKEGGGPFLLKVLGWLYWGINCICEGILWVIHGFGWVIDNFHTWF